MSMQLCVLTVQQVRSASLQNPKNPVVRLLSHSLCNHVCKFRVHPPLMASRLLSRCSNRAGLGLPPLGCGSMGNSPTYGIWGSSVTTGAGTDGLSGNNLDDGLGTCSLPSPSVGPSGKASCIVTTSDIVNMCALLKDLVSNERGSCDGGLRVEHREDWCTGQSSCCSHKVKNHACLFDFSLTWLMVLCRALKP